MNPQQRAELVNYRFSKAKETIAEADALMKMEMWNLVVNRLYYACFYAVSALLANSEIYFKTHSGTRQMFGLHFVAPGKVQQLTGNYYSKIFTFRHKGDYEDFMDFEESDVLPLMSPAKELINEIENILNLNNGNFST